VELLTELFGRCERQTFGSNAPPTGTLSFFQDSIEAGSRERHGNNVGREGTAWEQGQGRGDSMG